MMTDRKRLYLIDGYALIYRAYFAFIRNPLINSKGENTSATFGMTTFLLRLLREENPDYLGLVLDAPGPTYRHRLYPEYKATREKMPEELQVQLPRISEVIEAFRIPILEYEEYEADDVIGTLSRRASEEGLEAVIVSGDKDFCQLIDGRISMISPKRGIQEEEWYDRSKVVEKFGVPPERVTDLLALMGDISDNIPGVPGVGPKTAARLIDEFGSLEELLERIHDVSSEGLREKLKAHQEAIRLSRELVTIQDDLPIALELAALAVGDPDRTRLQDLFLELEFTSLLQEVGGPSVEIREAAAYETITSVEELRGLLAGLPMGQGLAVDVETTHSQPMWADPVGVSLAVNPGRAYYLPLAHTDGPNLPRAEALRLLKGPLADAEVPKIGHNIKYDVLVLRRAGLTMDGLAFDSMVAAYLLDPARRSNSLDVVALEYLDHQMLKYTDVVESKEEGAFAHLPVDLATRYSAEDADVTLRLKHRLEPLLAERELLSLFREVEMPLIPVLADMEYHGVRVNVAFFEKLGEKLANQLGELEEKIYESAGERFNINSPKQLQVILFEELGIQPVKRTKTGYSTDQEVLEKLADEHELPRLLLDYRELAKLKSTYVDALPQAVHAETGRIHASFNQTVATTGRLSSSEPNLQNIPFRTEVGREIRKGFVPATPDHRFLAADYSQIELRLMAQYSQDQNLLEAFRRGADIHRETAALIFECAPEEVSPDLRNRAKTINFGVIYGMGHLALSRQLGIATDEARAFIEEYFKRFPGVRQYQEEMIKTARRQGYVTTLLGRRRYLPEINSAHPGLRSAAERNAINSPLQGTAADLIKVAMVRIHRELKRRSLKAELVIQAHDELIFDLPDLEVEDVRELVREAMEGAISLSVPVVVQTGVGKNWYECK